MLKDGFEFIVKLFQVETIKNKKQSSNIVTPTHTEQVNLKNTKESTSQAT